MLLFIMLVVVLVSWGLVTREQQSGKLICKTVVVQFEDALFPALGTFSGFYDISLPESQALFFGRVKYVEKRLGGKTAFGYCSSLKAWLLSQVADENYEDRDESWFP